MRWAAVALLPGGKTYQHSMPDRQAVNKHQMWRSSFILSSVYQAQPHQALRAVPPIQLNDTSIL
jgi:hypothetical protein